MYQKKVILLLQNILKKIKKGNYEKYECNVIKKMYLKLKNLKKDK